MSWDDDNRRRQIDAQSVAADVDETLDAIGLLLGPRIVTGHNRVPLRRIIETAMIEVLHLHDHKTPLHQQKVAMDAPARGDARTPTSRFDKRRGR